MAAPPPVKGTFVSALDFVFSDDEGDEAASSSASGSRMGTPAGGLVQTAAGGTNGTTAIKGRNSAPTMSRMNARASKTNALAAITVNSSTAVPASSSKPAEEEIPSGPGPHLNPLRKGLKIPRATPLDFSTIRTSTPRTPNPPPRPAGKPRIFGLEDAPVYHPSVREFADPMEYIEKIAPEAREYGICKIVPPEGWRPSFAIDSETFRFKTRLQQLNSMEASARASLNFLEQLYLFHRQQGSVGITIPSIAGKPLDMWKLKREVGSLGGYAQVTNGRKWTTVGKAMGYNVTQNTGICSQLKTSYFRIIVPFEEYVKRVKLNGGPAPPDPVKVANENDDEVPLMKEFAETLAGTPRMSDGAETLATPASESGGPLRRTAVEISDRVRTASDRLNEALEIKDEQDLKSKANGTPGEVCEICNLDHDPDRIVLCDDCDKGFHLGCLSPPLRQVPTSQFYCDTCLLLNGSDYGFEEGQNHSLHSFRRRADAFKRRWLQDHPLPANKGKGKEEDSVAEDGVWAEQIAIEDHFEREFWRLVESPTETVEVEYGADVNSTKDGAGFPNLEVHPLDPYSRDGWNLNNLPILGGSLLRYIKSDISGMTIPWIYVGMVFSTFAWHKEDHYTYSINYHHLGDTKTWYGIPGEDDEKLEAAMKQAAPELFDQQPDLLFQLVTLMSPGRLKKNGVRVYAVDQRPNEFIITFPRAYHSGFNHGFNFNEAVNFALPDWLPIGLKCIERYREIKKNPVFSHDELLLTISQHDKNPRTSRWLLPHIRDMVERELGNREEVRALDPAPEEAVEAFDREEEEYQCEHCKVLCYLSQVTTSDAKHVVCPEHASTLPAGPKVFRLRFADVELNQLVNRVRSRAEKAGRMPDPATGLPEGLDQPRTSGRKRKPSAALLEAAGEQAEPAAQKVKTSRQASEELNSPEDEQDEGDIQIDGDIQVDPDLQVGDSTADASYLYPTPSLGGDAWSPYPPEQSAATISRSPQAPAVLPVSFSPPRPAPTARSIPSLANGAWAAPPTAASGSAGWQ
ncbi:hypothetical protein JCM21900_002735 [Sporobolomyces salmonicolor]